MKTIFFLSLAVFSRTVGLAQNSALINQQGTSHEVSVVQQGTGNTSVINQSTTQSGHRASVVQSGSGNVATINQGSRKDSTTGAQHSVNATQSGDGETIINQTNGGNSISVYQSDGKTADRKKKPGRKNTKE